MQVEMPWVKMASLGLAVAALAGCSPSTPTPPASTAASPAPGTDLRLPGQAQAAIADLTAQADTTWAIRVQIDETTASMTFVHDGEADTLGWDDGVITPVDADISFVGQTSFDVTTFNLDNVGAMFEQAAALTGSDNAQELQINEYNNGRVLMTVTTSPESQTIFFRPDASLIDWLTFTTPAGIEAALDDVAGDGVQVVALGLNNRGFYADVRVSQSVIERRIRPATLPGYVAQRNASTGDPAFSPSLVDPTVLASLLTSVPASLDKDDDATFVIDTRDKLPEPTIRISVGLTTKVFTLDGTDITKQV